MDNIRYPIGQFSPKSDLTIDERLNFIDQIPTIASRLRSILEDLEPHQLHIPYRQGGWTIQQVVHHLADNDMNAYLRFKRALTEDEPIVSSYREDLFAELSDYKDVPVETSIGLLDMLHKRFNILLQGLNERDFNRTLITQVLGTITLDIALQRFIWHNNHHIAQIESICHQFE